MGAHVIITEIKPTAALRARLEGIQVMTMDEAAAIGDVFITATGMKDVIRDRHFKAMRDGAVLCNTGHYDCEINLAELETMAKQCRTVRPNNEEFTLADGRRIYVLARGRLVNLAAAEGHPSEVMDMSFANQFLALLKLHRDGRSMDNTVHELPPEQDQEIGRIKLETMGTRIDELTAEQQAYASDYSAGT
jgi:adenosylhomocysteinase